MACLGMQIVSFGGDRRVSICGGVSEEMFCHLRRSMTIPGGHRRPRWRSPKLCLSNLGELRDGDAVDGTLQLARTEVKSGSRQKKPPTASPQLDQLIKESVTEIVKNIKEAPFLVQVYTEEVGDDKNLTSSTRTLKLVIGKATSESWPLLTQSWEDGNPTPDGVILVEELASTDTAALAAEKERDEIPCSDSACCTSNGDSTPSSAKVWGLLVQGRGASYPACYILKTCQVKCCFGLSTHFCLAKVDCFGQGTDFHLRKLWLQR